MKQVVSETVAQAWEKAFMIIFGQGRTSDDPEILKEDIIMIGIKNPGVHDRYHQLSPFPESLLKEYNDYLINGGGLGGVAPEHALYHERIFSYPPSGTDQVSSVVSTLKKNPHSKRAIISLWNQEADVKNLKVPCMLTFWFRVDYGRLVMHAHLRSSDAYKKLLMNLNLCATLLGHVSEKVGVPQGSLVVVIDSCQVYRTDEEAAKKLFGELAKQVKMDENKT